MLLPNHTLPGTSVLVLPFVVDAPGGIDGSWPSGALASVSMLGAAAVPFSWSNSQGLLLSVAAGSKSPAPYAVTFKLSFGDAAGLL